MSEPLLARGTAALFAGGLVVGFAVLALFATLDKRNRATIERLTEPSAAGEPAVFVMPEKGAYDPSAPIVEIKGAPLYEDEIVRRPDGAMMKAGHDDSGKYPLYRRFRSDVLQEPLHLKLEPGRYLRLASTPPKKRLEGAQEESAPENGEPEGKTEAPADGGAGE